MLFSSYDDDAFACELVSYLLPRELNFPHNLSYLLDIERENRPFWSSTFNGVNGIMRSASPFTYDGAEMTVMAKFELGEFVNA